MTAAMKMMFSFAFLFLVCVFSLFTGSARAQHPSVDSSIDQLRAELRAIPPQDQIVILNDLSSRYYQSGEFQKGFYYANWALSVANDHFHEGDQVYVETLHNLASLQSQIGQYAQAGALREKAYKLVISHFPEGDFLRLTVINSLAVHYSQMGKLQEAEPIFLELLKECTRTLPPDDEYTLGAITNLAGLYQDTGRHVAAIGLLEPVLAHYRQQDSLELLNAITTVGIISLAYLKVGKQDDALRLLRATLAVSQTKNGETHPSTLRLLNSLAYSLDKSGKIDEAFPIYQQVARDAGNRFGEDHPNTLTTELSVVSVLARKGDTRRALQHLERIGPLFLRWTTAQLHETVEATGRQRLVARQSTYPDVAFSLALMDGGAAGAKLAANTALQWKQLQGEQDALLTRFIATSRDAKTLDLAKRLALLRNRLAVAFHLGLPAATQVLNEVEHAETELAAASREFAQIQRLQRGSIDVVDAVLEEKTGLLEFRVFRPISVQSGLPEERHLLAVLIRPNMNPILRDLGLHSEIELKVQEATNVDDTNKRREALKELSEQLLKPFAAELRELRKIFIAPDGALNLLPIEMLPFEGSTYWIEAQDLRFVSTGRVLANNRAGKKNNRLVGIGAVTFDGSISPEQKSKEKSTALARTAGTAKFLSELKLFEALPETGPEIDNVAEAWTRLIGGNAITLAGAHANELAVKSMMEPPEVLHFATHGFFLANPQSNQQPMLLSGLALAGANSAIKGNVSIEEGDGILWAAEAMSLNLTGTKLVIMSACDTAHGVVDAYEGVYGLSRAFQIAGSENVVMTLWTLNDSRARAFMEEFYRQWLATGSSGDPADALRATKLKWLQSPNPARSDVRVWAPYMLVQRGK